MANPSEQLDFAYGHCESFLRQQDADRFFANLFAPADKRPYLMALYAFSAEIAHIQDITREPLTGEIRLQWWRDILQAGQGEGTTHPVAMAIADTISRFNLPLDAFLNLIDARVFDLYHEPMPDMNQLEGYCGETCSMLFQLAANILAGETVDVSEAAGHGGVAYATTGLIRAFPWHVRRGNLYLPSDLLLRHGADVDKVLEGGDIEPVRQALLDLRLTAISHLEQAEAALPNVPAAAKAAFLPLALVRPYLKLMAAKDYDPFATILDLAQWRKQWLLWRGSRKL